MGVVTGSDDESFINESIVISFSPSSFDDDDDKSFKFEVASLNLRKFSYFE